MTTFSGPYTEPSVRVIRLRALGQCVVEIGEHQVTPESDVLFALLLFLSMSAGRAVTRAELLDLFWPESSPSSARHRLRQALYQLKKLGAPLATPDSIVNVRAADVEIDYIVGARSRQALTMAVSESSPLEFLPHYAPTFSVPFARWVQGERDRMRASLRRHLLDVIADARVRGDHAPIIVLARACLDLDPLNGEATFALAEALAVRGNRAEALAVLDQYRAERTTEHDESSRAALALRKRIVESARRRPYDASRQAELVGRAEIVNEMSAWISTDAQARTVLALSGEAGIGKTRLLNECARIGGVHGFRCVEYRPGANGEERPLAGLLDLLPQLLALPGAVGCSTESYGRLTELTRGVHADSSIPEDTTDSAFRFATLRRSVLDLIEAVLVECGILLVLDDAHALDRPTLEILLDATRCAEHRLAVLTAMRPVGATAALLEARPDVRLVRVPRLDAAASRLVVSRDLPAHVVAERAKLIDWAVDLANGNPFFLVELSAHCGGDDPGESLPDSLQIALERKLDALSANARLVVQACAVLAQNATLARLETMLALPPHATASALSELELAGLIASREGRVGCRHDLIADAVLRGLGGTLGSYMHRRCAVVLDQELRSSPVASLAWDCALHFDAAGENARAFDVTILIAEQLLSLGLPQPSADLCTRAERYCKTAAQDAHRLLHLSHANRLLDDWTGVIGALERRRSLLRARSSRLEPYSDDEIALFEARWWRDYDGRVLRPVIRRLHDKRAPALHRLQVGVIGLIVADNHQRRVDAQRIAEAIESIHVLTPREHTERARARLVYNAAFGNLDIAVSEAALVVEAARVGDSSAALLRALRWSSIPLKFVGNTAAAIDALREAYSRAARLGLRSETWHAAEYLADLATDCEDIDFAREWAPLCLQIAKAQPTHTAKMFLSMYVMSRLALMESDLRKARKLLDDAQAHLGNPILRTRIHESVIAMDVLLLCRTPGADVPRSVIATLRRLHMRTRGCGVRDFELGALLNGLIATNRRAEARELRDTYLQSLRRSRLPLHSVLRDAGALLSFDGPNDSS